MSKGEKKIKNYLYIEQSAELKALRGSHKVKNAAKSLGVAPKTYYRYESGERKVPDGLLKLARILSKHADYPVSEKNKVEYSREDEVGYYVPRRIDDLSVALRSILKSFDDRFTLIESRLTKLEVTKHIADPGTAEEVTEKKAT